MAPRQTRWDNTAFYSGSDDPKITTTVESLRTEIASLTTLCEQFTKLIDNQPAESAIPKTVKELEKAYNSQLSIGRILRNTSMFIHSCLSVNARDAAASTWLPTLQQLGAQLNNATHPMYGYLARAEEPVIELLACLLYTSPSPRDRG